MSKNGSKSRALHNKPDGKSRVPWCTDFGDGKEKRKKKFPEANFCSKCDDWENRDKSSKRSQQTSRRYSCSANFGPNWFTPTCNKVDWCRNTIETKVGSNSKKRPGEPTVPLPGEDDAPHPPKKTRNRNKSFPRKEKLSITLARLQCQLSVQAKQLKAATASIDSLKADKNRLNSKVAYWKEETENKKYESGTANNNSNNKPAETLHEAITDSITSLIKKHYSKYGMKRVGKEISKAHSLELGPFPGCCSYVGPSNNP